ncbi:hypothetical protein [Nocardia asteroides]|uniref:hypothetical protein n=1 Tax=Nocardia asteroides TaxID=1824 RepID=UPI001E376D0C|nr:hypothetical protein [Nocardia asteroides]UGT64424.1 hypothetical protein LTT61_14535 [Nocardia asteroides]
MSDVLPIRRIDSAETAFAFVLGILFNQRVKADYAWQAPHRLEERLGTLSPDALIELSEGDYFAAFAKSPAIHPFTNTMAQRSLDIAHIIAERYDGDARNIWNTRITAREFIRRLSEFPGIGEHKARVALFVATVQLGISVVEDGGDYNISSCARLAQLFHPQHHPALTN